MAQWRCATCTRRSNDLESRSYASDPVVSGAESSLHEAIGSGGLERVSQVFEAGVDDEVRAGHIDLPTFPAPPMSQAITQAKRHRIAQRSDGVGAAENSASKRTALVACILASSLVGLDSMMTTVALPVIAADLGGGLAVQQWVVAAFLIALGSLLLPGGALGDAYDRWLVFGLGTLGFGLGALLCSLAPSAAVLIAGRLVQGVAAALMVPSVLAIITASFSGRERQRAIATWTAWSGVAVIAGPVLGGALVELLSWRAVYGVLVPLCALVVFIIVRAAPSRRKRRPADDRMDWGGGLLGVPAVGGPAFALIHGPVTGWGNPLILVALALGCMSMAALVSWERRARRPLIPPQLFANREFVLLNAITLLLYGGLISSGVYTVLFLNQTAGYSATGAGLAAAVPMVVLFVLSTPFGRLADRYPPRIFLGAGGLLAGTGILLLLRVDERADFMGVVLPSVLLHGLGLAMLVAPLTAAVLTAAGTDHAGVASGINNAVARLGSLFAIAVTGALIFAQFSVSVDNDLRAQRLGPAAQQQLEHARERPLSTDVAGGLTPADATRLGDALSDASVDSFRLGIGVIGGLVLLAGLIGALGVRARQRGWQAGGCPGGSLVGAHRDVA